MARKRRERTRRAAFTGLLALAAGSSVLALMTTTTSLAATVEGVTFADEHRTGGLTLQLKGVGLARFYYTIKLYVGALYLEQQVPVDQALSDVPKRLELEYFREIQGPDFGKAADEVLLQNVPEDQIAAIRSQINQLHALYENVRPGDRYALTYVPGVGTELALNGTRKGIIRGADFAKAYFAIWLGPEPISTTLKSQIMARP